jgi:hypothetical protein
LRRFAVPPGDDRLPRSAALKTAACLRAGRRYIKTLLSAMAYGETDERVKFFLLLTVTKHFRYFFSSN